jgi:hypothetical protein
MHQDPPLSSPQFHGVDPHQNLSAVAPAQLIPLKDLAISVAAGTAIVDLLPIGQGAGPHSSPSLKREAVIELPLGSCFSGDSDRRFSDETACELLPDTSGR